MVDDIDALREGIIAIAREAAAAILAVYDSAFAVEHKADASPLTAADLAAHHCIVDGLERLRPEIPILSEESAEDVPAMVRRQWRRLWLVDPLDGTREFVKRNGEFTVNIALIDDGVPVLAVVQAPVTGALWHAQHGRGAFRRVLRPSDPSTLQPFDPSTLRQAQGSGLRAQGTGLRAQDERALRQAQDELNVDVALHTRRPAVAPLRVAASRSHRDPRSELVMQRIGDCEPVALGSSLKFCRLAEGGMDVYPRFGPTSEWDTAAGQCVLEAAGGVVIDPRGRPLRYNQRDTILNGDFLALGDPQLPWRAWLE
ncbi:MAG: 3'(2'),5'-bisphosphate nucleotidase CysQ [Gammaproteobacteria bacterium]|nr:3'(2'),5'-bisphosphate nucleotidase CysQ [Gammaproteobacteria bacterium]